MTTGSAEEELRSNGRFWPTEGLPCALVSSSSSCAGNFCNTSLSFFISAVPSSCCTTADSSACATSVKKASRSDMAIAYVVGK